MTYGDMQQINQSEDVHRIAVSNGKKDVEVV
jgi:hypothetical protein